MYYGPVAIGSTSFAFQTVTTSGTGVPTAADASPTYAIFSTSSDTALLSGTMTAVSGATGQYKATSLSITVANGFAAGGTYFITVRYAISGTNRVNQHTFTAV
jgi:hypothetical protein